MTSLFTERHMGHSDATNMNEKITKHHWSVVAKASWNRSSPGKALEWKTTMYDSLAEKKSIHFTHKEFIF